MIIGIGVDVAAVERIRGLLERHGERFLKRIFTQTERDYSETFSDPFPHLAARFAAKEATYKAIPNPGPIRWKEIEVRNDPTGKPHLFLSGETLSRAQVQGPILCHLSLAHDAGVAIAQVVLETPPPLPAGEEGGRSGGEPLL